METLLELSSQVHGKRAAKRMHGLEAALVDQNLRRLPGLAMGDDRCIEVVVAGVAALFVAKGIKMMTGWRTSADPTNRRTRTRATSYVWFGRHQLRPWLSDWNSCAVPRLRGLGQPDRVLDPSALAGLTRHTNWARHADRFFRRGAAREVMRGEAPMSVAAQGHRLAANLMAREDKTRAVDRTYAGTRLGDARAFLPSISFLDVTTCT